MEAASNPAFHAQSLLVEDGGWQAFGADWAAQCAEAGERPDDYAPDIIGILRKIAAGEVEQTGIVQSTVCGVREGEGGRFWAVAMLNWVKYLPGYDEPVVRVRHFLLSPCLDYGLEGLDKYAQVLVGSLAAFLTIMKDHYDARHLHFHLRSPADICFFSKLAADLVCSPSFERVESRGAWLRITLAHDDSAVRPES